MFAQWDAKHYLSIAQHWYPRAVDQAYPIVFFPLYPILIWIGSAIVPAVVAAMLISWSGSIIGHAAFTVYLSELGYSRRTVWRIMTLLFASPGMVHFANAYNEGLYLGLTASFLLLLQRGQLFGAMLLGIFASFTRVMGTLLTIPFALASLVRRGSLIRPTPWFWLTPIVGSGYLLYLGINLLTYGSPFFYTVVQQEKWFKKPINPLWKYWQELELAFTSPGFWAHQNVCFIADQLLVLLVPLIGVLYFAVARRDSVRMPIYLWSWALAQILVVAAQSYWLSSGRYVVLILPLYIMLERLLRLSPVAYYSFVVLSAAAGVWGINRFSIAWWFF